MRHLIAFAIVAAFAAPVPNALAYQTDITDRADIALVLAVKEASDSVKEEVEACVRDGGERKPCLCAAANQIDYVRDAINDALRAHPEWDRKTLYVANTGDSQLGSLSLRLGSVPYSSAPSGCY